MLSIGFGKHVGAAGLHRLGTAAFETVVPAATRLILDSVTVLGGVATVENAHEEVALVEVVAGPDIPRREPELLDLSRRLMPSIPFQHLDVLVVDYLGKEISGDGMDPNITGRHGTWALTDPDRNPEKIVALRLTEATHGNACGLGFGRIPMWVDDDRTAIALALSTCPAVDPSRARLVRVHSTLHLEEMWVSEDLWRADGVGRPDLEPLSEPVSPEFTVSGRLADLPA
jgi:hypothetical protein